MSELDNHHNALTCPYCNPKGLVLVDAPIFHQQQARVDALEAALREVVDTFGPWHDDDCPGDDTCDCSAKPLHDQINAALAAREQP
jgi:hypothetical protein